MQVLWFALVFALLHLLCVLDDFVGVRIPCCARHIEMQILRYACTLGSSLLVFRTLGWSYHNIFLCPIGFLDPLIGCLFCWGIFPFANLLQSLDSQYSLLSSYYWSVEMSTWFNSFLCEKLNSWQQAPFQATQTHESYGTCLPTFYPELHL